MREGIFFARREIVALEMVTGGVVVEMVSSVSIWKAFAWLQKEMCPSLSSDDFFSSYVFVCFALVSHPLPS